MVGWDIDLAKAYTDHAIKVNKMNGSRHSNMSMNMNFPPAVITTAANSKIRLLSVMWKVKISSWFEKSQVVNDKDKITTLVAKIIIYFLSNQRAASYHFQRDPTQ
jgi:hypothetical protein